MKVIEKCSSRDPGMLSVMPGVLAFSLPHDLIIQAVHYLGKLKVIADSLSHSQATPSWLLTHNLHPIPRSIPFQVLASIAC